MKDYKKRKNTQSFLCNGRVTSPFINFTMHSSKKTFFYVSFWVQFVGKREKEEGSSMGIVGFPFMIFDDK